MLGSSYSRNSVRKKIVEIANAPPRIVSAAPKTTFGSEPRCSFACWARWKRWSRRWTVLLCCASEIACGSAVES